MSGVCAERRPSPRSPWQLAQWRVNRALAASPVVAAAAGAAAGEIVDGGVAEAVAAG
jgi:hypothetical protein